MQISTVIFRPGLSGTWLCWFINQHQDYPEFGIIPQHHARFYFPKHQKLPDWAKHQVTDYELPTANLVYCDYDKGIHTGGGSGMVHKIGLLAELENIKQHSATQNKNFSKVCFKLFPEHGFNRRDEHLIPEVFADFNITQAIIPILRTRNKDMIVGRVDKLKKSELHSGDFSAEQYIQDFMDNITHPDGVLYTLPEHCQVLQLDIGLLLDADQNEYQKLLDFIQSPPVNQWQDMIDKMKNEAYNEWWQRLYT